MRNRSTRALSDILGDLIKNMGIEGPLARGHVISTWESILSEQMRQHVEKCWMKGSRLFVRIDAPAWRQELHLRREEWRQRLNEELGSETVSEIVFR